MVLAVGFDLNLKRLVIVFQCFCILALAIEHQANAAEQWQSQRRKGRTEKVVGILLVVGLGHVWVLQAECFFSNLEDILKCCERIIIFALIMVDCTDAAQKHKHLSKKSTQE